MKKTYENAARVRLVFDRVAPESLRAMPYSGRGKRIEILVETPEFTCLCPWSGLPDFAHLSVTYVPDAKVVELKSFKYYIQSYRMVGILHEDAVNKICDDLTSAIRPEELKVELVFNLRGGIKTTVMREYNRGKRETVKIKSSPVTERPL